ncbi:MAG: hypothetical protein GF333_00765 [Candidatus Omnitrophica bacterium]|nr:hypothetical protein [Candidatus Omnitrophota bacterium]
MRKIILFLILHAACGLLIWLCLGVFRGKMYRESEKKTLLERYTRFPVSRKYYLVWAKMIATVVLCAGFGLYLWALSQWHAL